MSRVAGPLLLFLLLLPKTAFAHAPIPGIEGFYAGLLHPLIEITQGLLLIGLGVLIAQHPRAITKRALLLFLVALMSSGLVNFVIPGLAIAELILLPLALIVGVLVAIARPLHQMVVIPLVLAAGITSGTISVPEAGALSAMIITATGSFVGAIVIFLYAFGAADWLLSKTERPWLSIGLRIIGSWVAAICLLMLALSLRG